MSIKDIPLRKVVSDNIGYSIGGRKLDELTSTQLIGIIKNTAMTPTDRYMAVAFLQYNYFTYKDNREYALKEYGIPMSVWWTH